MTPATRAAWRRWALLLALPLLVLAALAPAAGAQDGEEPAGRVVLRRVDAEQLRAVEAVVSWSGDGDIGDAVVLDGGEEVDFSVGALGDVGLRHDIYFVVDTSTSTDRNNLAGQSRAAIAAFLEEGLPADTRVSILRAGSAVQTVQPPTADVDRLLEVLAQLQPEGEGAVLDALARAGGQAGQRLGSSLATVVLITDGVTRSSLTRAQTATQLKGGGALLHVVALPTDRLDTGLFSSLARESGGTFRTIPRATDLTSALEELRPELLRTAVLTFATEARSGPQAISVTVGDASTAGTYFPRTTRVGFQNLRPIRVIEVGDGGLFGGRLGKIVGLVSAALALILFAYAVILIFVRQDEPLTSALRPYEGYAAGGGADADDGDGGQPLAQTALLQRAVALTESFAERRGFLERVERALEKAGTPLRAGEAMFFYVAVVVLVTLLAAALSGNIVATLLAAFFALLIPPVVLNLLAANKKRQFENLLPDTLQLLSSTLRAGYSMMQGVEAVAAEAAEPMGAELRRVVTEARLGRPVEEALEAAAERMDSKDFAWAVMAIRIQREVGGNLAELLLTVAETMTQRERLRRDIRSLTAEGRMSAWVLVGLPVALGIFLYTTNSEYIGRLFDNLAGQLMLGGGVLAMVVGLFWMFKIIDIEV